jgi:hypothetical protein
MCIADRLVNLRAWTARSMSVFIARRALPDETLRRRNATLLSGAIERMDSAGLLHCLYVNIP